MPTVTDEAICIRHWDYSETSQTVGLFSRDHGVVRGLAKGAKREKGRFSGGIDLLARGEFVAIIKPGRDLHTLTEWTLLEVYWPLRRHLEAHRLGLFMADLIHHMVQDHDPHPGLYRTLVTALGGLGDSANHGRLTLAFLWSLLTETGYQPSIETHGEGDAGNTDGDGQSVYLFAPESGGLIRGGDAGPRWRVRRETVELLRRVATGAPLPAQDTPAVGRACRLLAAYVRHILGHEPPTMSMVFPDLQTPRTSSSGDPTRRDGSSRR